MAKEYLSFNLWIIIARIVVLITRDGVWIIIIADYHMSDLGLLVYLVPLYLNGQQRC